ncbi:thioredoxin family protein [Rhodohalobacter sp.]|uniref:thioredoxin family protein n=1 Tax=Rhodohalobacter sp. TaxID=1974210 RepID=UPI002ACD2635|nr:thioredoxin family protein [Rhodohalobacter sp.]MDZ7758574.1 thioredoxin family protein [Rhodohalobacter sp.]
MSTDVKILQSSCCASGSPIKERIKKIAAENSIEISIEELSDIQETAKYGTTAFPSLVVDGEVYDYKKLSSDKEILSILNQ